MNCKVIKKENAVSPVVGVMLMLVVTIIVAAVIAAFASGFVGTAQTSVTPTASFNFKLHASGGVVGSGTSWTQPGVECFIPVATGEFSSNDLMIVTTYVVPDKYKGNTLSNAGKTIITKTNGRLQDYGFDLSGITPSTSKLSGSNLPIFDINNYDPFNENTYICSIHIIPTAGNGATVGPEQAQAKFFGGNLPIGGGTLWWFKDINEFLGFDIKDRATYGFTEGSEVHIDVIHLPSGTVISSQDVKAVW